MQKTGRLEGKVAFVSGATSGIGRAAALIFAQEGAKVVAVGRRVDEGNALAKEIGDAGGEALFVRTDVTEPDSVEHAIKETVKAFGKLDILLNNAGGAVPGGGAVTETPLDVFWETIKLNLFGTWIACKFGVPEIVRAGGGSVINMVSLAGVTARGGMDAYTAAKGGVVALTRSMAVEFAPHKVRVNAIAPAIVGTDRVMAMVASLPSSQEVLKTQSLGVIDPREVAYAAVYFSSDESATTTGQTLVITGGQSS